MTLFHFVILSLAIWRISNMLVAEDGPWLVFEHLRLKLGLLPPAAPGWTRETDPPGRMPGTLLACVWCMSVWISLVYFAIFAIWPALGMVLSIPFALSAAACLVDRWSNTR